MSCGDMQSYGKEEIGVIHLIFYTDSAFSVILLKQTLKKFKPTEVSLTPPQGMLHLSALKRLNSCFRSQVSNSLSDQNSTSELKVDCIGVLGAVGREQWKRDF